VPGRVIVDVSQLSKAYYIWATPAARLHGPLLGRVGQLPFLPAGLAERCRQLSQGSFKKFYALRDVSLRVEKGETVGIVGRNGSGKSTLLQVLAGTLAPTTGSVSVEGRVTALLELGAGFAPEFSGRENIQLNAAILGLSPAEIEARSPQIVAFADVGEFIDQPVKTYSSGMYVRLAFAVAINLDADVLIVDEALSVGDEAFQRKCFSRIRAFQERGGTILFVSHSAAAVVELCNRAVLLDQGELLLSGPPKEIVSHYHKLIYAPPERAASLREELRRRAPGEAREAPSPPAVSAPPPASLPEPDGDGEFDPGLVPRSTISYVSLGAVIENVCLKTTSGRPVNVLQRRREYVYEYSVRFTQSCFNVRFGMLIKTVSGFELGGAVSAPPSRGLDCVEAGSRLTVRFQFRCLLVAGTYFLNAGVVGTVDATETFLHRVIDVAMMRVMPEPHALCTGLVDFCAEPEVVVQAPVPDPVAG